jgi:hypothetical protein
MPEFSMPSPRQERMSAMVSAPVTREIPGSDYRIERKLSRITLSPQEKEIARLSGLTLEQYAEGKLDLMRRKEAGEIG